MTASQIQKYWTRITGNAARRRRRATLHTLRIASAFAAGLVVCAALTSFAPFDWASAHAQKLAEVRKKADRKAPTSKDARKDHQERAPFTVEEEDAAVIPGIPDARVWGE